MAPSKPEIAIIGAGLSGLSLALALHQQSIPCKIYESRPAPLNIGGAIMLSPNALKILNALGVYDRIRAKGYNFETLQYRDGEGKLLEVYEFGGEEKYGFKGLRIYRYVLIDELLAMMQERDLSIEFGRKFSHIISETEDEVSWEFADGSTQSASILIGADGIHSTVRQYLYPDLHTTFTNMAGVTAAVPTAQLQLPPDYYLPVTITNKHGGFVIAPQQVDGSEVLIGKQKRVGDQNDAIFTDRAAAVAFLQLDASDFPEIVQNAVSQIDPFRINIWPFHIVPILRAWTSSDRHTRVIILGDAAHAIPPSAGQGINQAFEDVYMLALLLGSSGGLEGRVKMPDALKFWQTYRQQRIDKIMLLNKQIDIRRMPEAERGAEKQEEIDLSWLYSVDLEQVVGDWVEAQVE